MIGTCIQDEVVKAKHELEECNRALAGAATSPVLSGLLYRNISRLTNRLDVIHRLTHLPDNGLVKIDLDFVCHTCPRRHRETVTPERFPQAYADWRVKHPGHDVEFYTVKREIPKGYDDRKYEQLGKAPWYLEYKPNADIKTAYAASADLTITLATLACSATLVAGRESTAISNTSNLYLDAAIMVKLTAGATGAQVGLGQFWAYGSVADTPAYPQNHTGSDSGVTHTAETRNTLNFWRDILSAATANKTYSCGPRSLAYVFDYVMPQEWGFWVTSTFNSGTNTLHGTAGNHAITYLPIYATG